MSAASPRQQRIIRRARRLAAQQDLYGKLKRYSRVLEEEVNWWCSWYAQGLPLVQEDSEILATVPVVSEKAAAAKERRPTRVPGSRRPKGTAMEHTFSAAFKDIENDGCC